MISDVLLAAMMPASRAVWSGSPFATARLAIARRAAAFMRISASAIASRAVSALAETSTIFTRPCASTCVKQRAASGWRGRLFGLGFDICLSASEEERQAFHRHGQVDVLEFDPGRHLQRTR